MNPRRIKLTSSRTLSGLLWEWRCEACGHCNSAWRLHHAHSMATAHARTCTVLRLETDLARLRKRHDWALAVLAGAA